jgi:hypothetical protein
LPSWQKWRKDGSWKEGFLKCVLSPCDVRQTIMVHIRNRVLFRLWHRGATSCTTDEAWTKSASATSRVVLVANSLGISSLTAMARPTSSRRQRGPSIQ